MNLRSGEGHSPSHIADLQPGSVKIRRPRQLGDDAEGASFHHLRDKAVGIEERAFDRDEKSAWSSSPRIVRDVIDDGANVSGKFGISYGSDLIECYWLLAHGN